MSNSKLLNSPRLLELKRKRQRHFVNRVMFTAGALLIALIGFSFVLKIPQFNISEVVVEGNEAILPESIKEVVNEDIAGKYVHFFPRSNFILYPKREIKQDLLANVKRIKEVSVGLTDSNVLKVVVTERKAEYAWCGEKVSASEKCYFLDKEGYVFDESPYFSRQVYFKFYGGDVNAKEPLGAYFSQEYLDKLVKFKKILEAMKLNPVGLVLEGSEVRILLGGSSGTPEILIKADADLEKVAENLQSALSTEPLRTEFKTKYQTLQHIDLRFGNKVYYKF